MAAEAEALGLADLRTANGFGGGNGEVELPGFWVVMLRLRRGTKMLRPDRGVTLSANVIGVSTPGVGAVVTGATNAERGAETT